MTEQASAGRCRAGNQPAGGAVSVAVMRFHLPLKSKHIFEAIHFKAREFHSVIFSWGRMQYQSLLVI